jgi:hypothetical protein
VENEPGVEQVIESLQLQVRALREEVETIKLVLKEHGFKVYPKNSVLTQTVSGMAR